MSLQESGTAQSMEDFAEASKEQSAAKQKGNRRSSQEKVNYGDYALSVETVEKLLNCLLYTSPSPRDRTRSRMPSSA